MSFEYGPMRFLSATNLLSNNKTLKQFTTVNLPNDGFQFTMRSSLEVYFFKLALMHDEVHIIVCVLGRYISQIKST